MSELFGLKALNATGAVTGAVGRLSQQGAQTAATRANLGWMDIQRQDALRNGQLAASRARMAGNQLASAQGSAFAGQGTDINSGSAGQVRNDSRLFAQVDALNIENSAYRQAMGMQAQQANMASSLRNQRNNTLLQIGQGFGMAGMRAAAYQDRYGGLGNGLTPEQQAESNRIANVPFDYFGER